MRRMLLAGLLLSLTASAAAQRPTQAPPPPPAVTVGEPMPDFTLPYLETAPGTARPQTKQVTLSSFRGKQPVVLAFFPAAFSPG